MALMALLVEEQKKELTQVGTELQSLNSKISTLGNSEGFPDKEKGRN